MNPSTTDKTEGMYKKENSERKEVPGKIGDDPNLASERSSEKSASKDQANSGKGEKVLET